MQCACSAALGRKGDLSFEEHRWRCKSRCAVAHDPRCHDAHCGHACCLLQACGPPSWSPATGTSGWAASTPTSGGTASGGCHIAPHRLNAGMPCSDSLRVSLITSALHARSAPTGVPSSTPAACHAPVPLWGLPLCAWVHDPPTHPLPHCHTHLVHTHPPTTTTAPHPPQLLLLVQLRPGVHQAPRRRAAVSAGVQAAGPWARSLGCWRGLGSRGLDRASRPWFSRAHHLVGCLAEC